MKFFNKFLVLIIFLLFINRNGISQWQWIYPVPQGMTLNSVSFIDNNTGIFSGVIGVLLRTTNSGNSYENINLGFNFDLNSCLFVNQNLCFAAGSFSKIFRSTNSGINWSGTTIEFNYGVTGISFVNDSTGWVTALYSNLYKTTNGGVNWIFSELRYIQRANSVFFLNERVGFVAGSGNYVNMIKTTNGGGSWGRIDCNYPASINCIFFQDSLKGFTCGTNGEISRTTDGGKNWVLQNTGVNAGTFTSIKFVNKTGFSTYQNTNGICAVFKSEDDGSNWVNVYSDTLAYFNSLEYKDQHITVTGSMGRIVKSTDNGISWTSNKENIINGFSYIKFINEMTGIACGWGYNCNRMYKTTSGGENWIIYGSDTNVNNVYSIEFADLNTGYKVGGSSNLFSRIYKTTNGGINWIQKSFQSSRTIDGIDFLDANTGLICGMGGLIAKTTNGAETWQIANTGSPHWHDVITYMDNNNCISGNSNGDVYRSTDGGNNWFISSNVGSSINSISFGDVLTGYIGANGVFKTTDGGYNWVSIVSGGICHNLKFYNSNTGFISTYNGRIYRTTNGGLNWADESYISSGLNFGAYTFIDAETVYMLGSSRLFKTTNGGILTNQPEKSISIPVSFNLLQNFPNPFNPTTTISFSIAKSSFVRLNIYGISGKIIKELINEFRLSGDHNIIFDAANLPSGVYFCKLEVSSSNQLSDGSNKRANYSSATKKMFLIK